MGRHQIPQEATRLLQLHLQLLPAALHVLLQFHLQPRHVFPLREPLGLGNAVAQLLLTLLQLAQILQLLALVLPAVLQLLELVERLAAALLVLHPLLHWRLLGGQQRAFDAAQLRLSGLHHRRLGGGLHLQIRSRFIDQIDRLIGQAAITDVAIRQTHGRLEGVIANADAVVQLVALAHTTQDLQRHIQGWFLDQQLLEAPVQHGIFLQRAAVFLDGGGPNAAQLTSGQGWFEHAAGIGARTITVHQGVDFIDEQHHPFTAFIAGGDLLKNAAQALFELTAVFGASDQGAEIQRDQTASFEGIGHFTGHHPLGQQLSDGGFANAGLTNQHRVVFVAAREHLNQPPNVGAAANHRIQAAFPGQGGEVAPVLGQSASVGTGLGGLSAGLIDGNRA